MSIPGSARPDGTNRYADRFPEEREANFYRTLHEQSVSSLGIGTYLGEATDENDESYYESIQEALRNGINLIDTAINYRFQRSERTIGRALADLVAGDELNRDEFLVATKGGFVPFDGTEPEDPMEYIKETFIEPGVAAPDDFTRNGHCMTPEYLEHQINGSLDNLGLDTVDVYYVHNPESQLSHKNRETVYEELTEVFSRLEELVSEGKIASYGIATWDGLRVDPQQKEYLQLEEIHQCAREAGGDEHHFRAVQLPFNLGMSEALTKANQPVDGTQLTPLEACKELDLMAFTSASILQGRLARDLPDEIRADLEDFDSDVHRALQFTRSAPGVTSALVGMKSAEHVRENLELARRSPYAEETFRERFLQEV